MRLFVCEHCEQRSDQLARVRLGPGIKEDLHNILTYTNHPTHGDAFSFMLVVLNTFLQIRVFIRIWRTLDSNAQHNICLSRRHAVSLDATFKMSLPSIFLPLWSCLQMLQKPSSFRNIYFILTLSKTCWMLGWMLDVIW